MKRLLISAMLAVALIAVGFGFCQKAEAKERLESRFMTIGGELCVVTENVSDSGLREVVNVVDIDISDVKVAARASKQRPAIAAKKEISPIATKVKKTEEPKKDLNTVIKEVAPANNTADINTVKKESPVEKMVGYEVREKIVKINLKNFKRTLVKDTMRKLENGQHSNHDTSDPEELRKYASANKSASEKYITERYDKHIYDQAEKRSVKDGDVDYFLVEHNLNSISHVFRDVDSEKMEMFNNESGHYACLDKPEALKITYLSDYEKKYEVVKIIPTKELYDFAESRRISPAEAAVHKNAKAQSPSG